MPSTSRSISSKRSSQVAPSCRRAQKANRNCSKAVTRPAEKSAMSCFRSSRHVKSTVHALNPPEKASNTIEIR